MKIALIQQRATENLDANLRSGLAALEKAGGLRERPPDFAEAPA